MQCRASRSATISNAVIDQDYFIFVYALSLETREIIVFKITNLYSNPVPTECTFIYKFKLGNEIETLND